MEAVAWIIGPPASDMYLKVVERFCFCFFGVLIFLYYAGVYVKVSFGGLTLCVRRCVSLHFRLYCQHVPTSASGVGKIFPIWGD